MKKAKWIISIFIFLLCFILGSELYQNYLGTFSNQFFYFDVSVVDDRSDLYELLTQSAAEQEMGVFSVDRTTLNSRQATITIYSTDTTRAILDEQCVFEGEKRSLFSGTTDICVQDFSGIINDRSIVRYYFTGTKEQVTALRDTVYNTYATSYIHRENTTGLEWLIGAVWTVSLLFLLLLTWLDIQFQKKEIFLRLSLGSSVWQIIGKNVLADTAVFAGIFALTYCVLGNYVFLGYGLPVAFIAMIAFGGLNALLYLSLLNYDYKQILYGANINERTLSNSYVLKAITMIVAIASLSVNVTLISENGRYLGYYKDINQYADYGLLHVSPAMDITANDYNNEFSVIKTGLFLDYYAQNKVGFSLSFAQDIEDVPIVVLNDNMSDLLGNQSLLSDLGNYDYHVFVPQNRPKIHNEDNIEFALQTAVGLFGQDTNSIQYEVIYYDNTDILYFDFLETSKLPVGFDKVENPIFVYCTLSDEQLNTIIQSTDDLMHESTFNNFLFKLTEEEVELISTDDGLKAVSYTSLVDQCGQYKSSLLRVVLLNSIISLFLMVLEMVIIVTIIKLEYMVNAKELSIKKILGYSVFHKNRTIFLLNFCGAGISIITMIIVSLMFEITKVSTVLLVGTALTVIEAGLIVLNILKLERTNIPKILKGGSL